MTFPDIKAVRSLADDDFPWDEVRHPQYGEFYPEKERGFLIAAVPMVNNDDSLKYLPTAPVLDTWRDYCRKNKKNTLRAMLVAGNTSSFIFENLVRSFEDEEISAIQQIAQSLGVPWHYRTFHMDGAHQIGSFHIRTEEAYSLSKKVAALSDEAYGMSALLLLERDSKFRRHRAFYLGRSRALRLEEAATSGYLPCIPEYVNEVNLAEEYQTFCSNRLNPTILLLIEEDRCRARLIDFYERIGLTRALEKLPRKKTRGISLHHQAGVFDFTWNKKFTNVEEEFDETAELCAELRSLSAGAHLFEASVSPSR